MEPRKRGNPGMPIFMGVRHPPHFLAFTRDTASQPTEVPLKWIDSVQRFCKDEKIYSVRSLASNPDHGTYSEIRYPDYLAYMHKSCIL